MVTSWGRVRHAAQQIEYGSDLPEGEKTLLSYGLGRSYGDSCLNDGGIALITGDRFIAFDREAGTITCEGGTMLRSILQLCRTANPDGSHWFLPVTPGTQHITVGGAIANDVHGKNHAQRGTFGQHVQSFMLQRSDGTFLCSPSENVALWQATIGGLGLTGRITQATLQLMRVPGLMIESETIPMQSLAEFFALADASSAWEYSVGWVDCLAKGEAVGRGLFSRGRHVAGACPAPRKPLAMPFELPFTPLNRWTLGLFNACYRRRIRRARTNRQPYWKFLYPLDAIAGWNRFYGPRGFYQYQCVIPPGRAKETIRAQLETIAQAGEGSFLIVLKNFGDQPSPGMLSFPMPGTTLAVDFPNRGERTTALIAALDALTLAAGGRVYPAKDAVMSPQHFEAYYPNWRDFSRWIDPRFSSSFWRRVTATDEPSP